MRQTCGTHTLRYPVGLYRHGHGHAAEMALRHGVRVSLCGQHSRNHQLGSAPTCIQVLQQWEGSLAVLHRRGGRQQSQLACASPDTNTHAQTHTYTRTHATHLASASMAQHLRLSNSSSRRSESGSSVRSSAMLPNGKTGVSMCTNQSKHCALCRQVLRQAFVTRHARRRGLMRPPSWRATVCLRKQGREVLFFKLNKVIYALYIILYKG